MYGTNLRTAREKRGLNLDQAADLTGIKKNQPVALGNRRQQGQCGALLRHSKCLWI